MNLPASIDELFRRTASDRGNEPACGEVRNREIHWLTWRDLQTIVDQRSDVLAQRGIRAGQRVALVGANSLAWLVNDLVLHRLRAVSVPLSAAYTQAQQQQLADHAGCHYWLAGDEPPRQLSPSERTALASPPDLATIIYTSGTTGTPLGVMLTQQNLVANTWVVSHVAAGSYREKRLAVLPWSHAYARTCDLYAWLVRGSRLVVSRGRDHLIDDLAIAQPTAMSGVPYLYQRFARRATGDALRQLLGGHLKRAYCGGAPLAPQTAQLYAELDLPLLDGYGLTEASPVVSMTHAGEAHPGTVGRPLANIEVRIADDGEILVRGPSVMLGYWGDDEATRQVLRDGWLHTGDLGLIDAAGRLQIVGRRKELIVLSTGHKVAPAPLEARLAASPWIEQVAVVGESHSHLVALIVPNPERVRAEVRRRRLWVWSKQAAVAHRVIREVYRREIDERLADLPVEQRPRDFALLTQGFTPERGELTAKLSLRRQAITEHYRDQIQRLYQA